MIEEFVRKSIEWTMKRALTSYNTSIPNRRLVVKKFESVPQWIVNKTVVNIHLYGRPSGMAGTLAEIIRISIGEIMDINIIRSEVEFFKSRQKNTESIDALKSYFKSEKSLDSLEQYRFDDDYRTLGSKIYQMIEDFPVIVDEVQLIASMLNIDEEYISNSIKKLRRAIGYSESINICTTLTGFDCAAGAYGNTIYFGLEWFTNPDAVGIKCTDYRYKYMKMLHNKIDDFVEETVPHEIVHLMSVKPDSDNFMFRIIEEGRACYVTHLLNPDWTLNKILPMDDKDISTAIENEEQLMKLVHKSLSVDPDSSIKQLFSPMGRFMDIGLAGYYIAYKLIEKYFDEITDFDEKLSKIMKFTNSDDLYRQLARLSNS